eukprot:353532-Chlamydomonas_euryale.AAC.9
MRLWLDDKVELATPSNVLVGFDPGAGGTLFDLNALQVGGVVCGRVNRLCLVRYAVLSFLPRLEQYSPYAEECAIQRQTSVGRLVRHEWLDEWMDEWMDGWMDG